MAKATFQQAIKADPGAGEARMNLAGLFRHYGHDAQAAELLRRPMPADMDREGNPSTDRSDGKCVCHAGQIGSVYRESWETATKLQLGNCFW